MLNRFVLSFFRGYWRAQFCADCDAPRLTGIT